ncbi:MAG: MgtC/SapB family protein [Phycisphaerales bacterium]|nr:MAG: MgtC/SapB family protein [Phycisphaerales bacterium]
MMDPSFQLFGERFGLEWSHVLRLAVALILGGLIGLEREFRDKPAGFRTIILITAGACIFSIISEAAAWPYTDNTRIAAQIVTGVGFLGAGAIIRGRGNVYGLTTAATIWAVAAIGMAVGFGEYLFATAATVGILIVLLLFNLVERAIGNLKDTQAYHFGVEKHPDALQRITGLFKEARLRTVSRVWWEDKDSFIFDVVARGSKANHDRLREKMALSEEFRLRSKSKK